MVLSNVCVNIVCNSTMCQRKTLFLYSLLRCLWSWPCSCWSPSLLLPFSPFQLTSKCLYGEISGHTMCPTLSSLFHWSFSAAVESFAANTHGTWWHWYNCLYLHIIKCFYSTLCKNICNKVFIGFYMICELEKMCCLQYVKCFSTVYS